MKAIEILKKQGYRQRYNDKNIIIYDLKVKARFNALPDTILFYKGDNNISEVEFATDNLEEYTHINTFSFNINKEILQGINKQIEEIEGKLSK